MIWAGRDTVMGDDLGHLYANTTIIDNELNESNAVSFVQLLGDGHSRTVVMMSRYDNRSLPYMYYHQSGRKELEFDWLLISGAAPKNQFLQFGSFDMEFHSAEKCRYVPFDQVVTLNTIHLMIFGSMPHKIAQVVDIDLERYPMLFYIL